MSLLAPTTLPSLAPSTSPTAFNPFRITQNGLVSYAFEKEDSNIVLSYTTPPSQLNITPVVSIWPGDDCGGRTKDTPIYATKSVEYAEYAKSFALSPFQVDIGNATSQGGTSQAEDTNVTIALNTSSIANSDSVWTYNTTTDVANLFFCVRFDQVLVNIFEAISVSFVEAVLSLSLDMTAGIDNIQVTELNYVDPQGIDKDVSMNYGVTAYQCENTNGEWVRKINPNPLAQNSYAEFCIFPDENAERAINVEGIKQLDMIQEASASYNIISNSVATVEDLTTVTTGINDGKGVYIKTLIISRFFQSSNPDPIKIKGVAKISFDTSRKARKLGDKADGRSLEEEWVEVTAPEDASFSLQLQLTNSPIETLTEGDTAASDEKSSATRVAMSMIGILGSLITVLTAAL